MLLEVLFIRLEKRGRNRIKNLYFEINFDKNVEDTVYLPLKIYIFEKALFLKC